MRTHIGSNMPLWAAHKEHAYNLKKALVISALAIGQPIYLGFNVLAVLCSQRRTGF
jgi:hypothetical protein